jgi:protocatechuate 3,4-dioxygenase beta subunit
MENEEWMSRRQLLRSTALTGGVFGLLSVPKTLAQRIEEACGRTPPQTEGPFYPVDDQLDKDSDLTRLKGHTERAKGQVIYVQGTVTDESCAPVNKALVEIWQACASGRYNHPGDTNPAALDPHFQYWGKATTEDDGKYLFKTILPGHYPASPTWTRPAHIHFKVFARGFFDLTTQLYFEGNPYNAGDLILKALPPAERNKVVIPLTEAGQGFELGSKIGIFDIAIRRVAE